MGKEQVRTGQDITNGRVREGGLKDAFQESRAELFEGDIQLVSVGAMTFPVSLTLYLPLFFRLGALLGSFLKKLFVAMGPHKIVVH